MYDYLSVLPKYMYILCACNACRVQKKVSGPLGLDRCEPIIMWGWELNPGPVEEQVLLTTEDLSSPASAPFQLS